MKNTILHGLILSCLLAACQDNSPTLAERGDIIRTKQIGTFTPQDITNILNSFNYAVPFNLTHDVKAVKIAYMTPEPGGKLVNASGAILYPELDGPLPMISFQHGTQTHRYLVPSLGPNNSEASLAGSVAASMGYIVVAADYLGLGESEVVAPYLLNATSATTVIDMLRAAQTYMEENGIIADGSLYLAGYSQGGVVTMGMHHEMEQHYSDEFTVSAAAPLAGAYDLNLTVDSILSRETYREPVLVAQLVYTYNHYYEWDRMGEIFREPYASAIPGYLQGNYMPDDINARLTTDLSSLLQEQFITDYRNGDETDLAQALGANSLLTYTPDAPVRLIYSDGDSTVPPQNAVAALDYYVNSGKTNADSVVIRGLNHKDAALPAIVAAMQWFEELRGN
jgi:pimeloyl-ACP methyl ester carboxylesterase